MDLTFGNLRYRDDQLDKPKGYPSSGSGMKTSYPDQEALDALLSGAGVAPDAWIVRYNDNGGLSFGGVPDAAGKTVFAIRKTDRGYDLYQAGADSVKPKTWNLKGADTPLLSGASAAEVNQRILEELGGQSNG